MSYHAVTINEEDKLLVTSPPVPNSLIPAVSHVACQIALWVQPTDGPLHLQTTSYQDPTNDLPLAVRHPCYGVNPTWAIQDACKTIVMETAAREAGEEWVGSESELEALMSNAFAFHPALQTLTVQLLNCIRMQ